MRRQDSIGIDLRIVKEPVRGLKLCRLERLRKRFLRAESKPTRQRNQTPRQTRVAQIRFAELGACPIVRIAFASQSRLPLQHRMTEVNIAPSRLQAENPLFTHRDVGNPEGARACSLRQKPASMARVVDVMRNANSAFRSARSRSRNARSRCRNRRSRSRNGRSRSSEIRSYPRLTKSLMEAETAC